MIYVELVPVRRRRPCFEKAIGFEAARKHTRGYLLAESDASRIYFRVVLTYLDLCLRPTSVHTRSRSVRFRVHPHDSIDERRASVQPFSDANAVMLHGSGGRRSTGPLDTVSIASS